MLLLAADSVAKPSLGPPRTAERFEEVAAWWEREAQRGYASSDRSRWYAANMRGAAKRRRKCRRALPWTPGYDFPIPFAEKS